MTGARAPQGQPPAGRTRTSPGVTPGPSRAPTPRAVLVCRRTQRRSPNSWRGQTSGTPSRQTGWRRLGGYNRPSGRPSSPHWQVHIRGNRSCLPQRPAQAWLEAADWWPLPATAWNKKGRHPLVPRVGLGEATPWEMSQVQTDNGCVSSLLQMLEGGEGGGGARTRATGGGAFPQR